jgi:hypothetical protein
VTAVPTADKVVKSRRLLRNLGVKATENPGKIQKRRKRDIRKKNAGKIHQKDRQRQEHNKVASGNSNDSSGKQRT